MKTVEKLLPALIIILLIAGIYVALRNIDFFDVKEIDITVNGPLTNVSVEMQRILNPQKGRNIFEINLRSLKRKLLAVDGVSSVSIKRYYPDKLILDITYMDVDIRCYSIQKNNDTNYYFVHDGVMEQVGQETWESFDKPVIVELNPTYAQKNVKWECDQGFLMMVNLTKELKDNNLITNIKYDNNNGDDFGKLVIDLSSLNSTLYVRELVSANRLSEALDFISSQFSSGSADVIYNLYATDFITRRDLGGNNGF